MPDFRARLQAGVTPTVWSDHEGAGVSRINPTPQHPSKYLRGAVGTQVTMFATPNGGSEAPNDAALGGRLFSSDFVEYPGALPPAVSNPAGFTSIQQFTPNAVGHYLWMIRRTDGGAIGFHLDAE